jgi:hypothetical protein
MESMQRSEGELMKAAREGDAEALDDRSRR